MSRAANDLEFFPRRRSGFKDAGFTVEQFSQVISRDCFVDSKHTSHLFLMLDFDPQSPDHTSVTLTDPLFAPISKVCQGAKTILSPLKSRKRQPLFGEASDATTASCQLQRPICPCQSQAGSWVPIYRLALRGLRL